MKRLFFYIILLFSQLSCLSQSPVTSSDGLNYYSINELDSIPNFNPDSHCLFESENDCGCSLLIAFAKLKINSEGLIDSFEFIYSESSFLCDESFDIISSFDDMKNCTEKRLACLFENFNALPGKRGGENVSYEMTLPIKIGLH